MRDRSKSLFADAKDIYSSDNEEVYPNTIDIDYDAMSEKDEIDEDNNEAWGPQDKMILLKKVWQQLPAEDKQPYKKRLEMINWKAVVFNNYNAADVQKKFEETLNEVRTFRLLGEIIKDVEKIVLPQLNLPTKPAPPMALFVRENKDKIRNYMESKSIRYVRAVADLYNELTEKEKERYKQLSVELRKNYQEVVSKYNLATAQKEKHKMKTVEVKQVFLKGPAGTFIRDRTSDGSVGVATAKKEYAQLSKDDKLTWILRWVGIERGEKLNYAQRMRALKHCTKEEIEIIDDYEERPKTVSAYRMYMKDYFANLRSSPDVSHKDKFRGAGAGWKSLSEEKKMEYTKFAKIAKASYMANCIRYTASLPKDRQEYEIKLLTTPAKDLQKRTSLNKTSTATPNKEYAKEIEIIESAEESISTDEDFEEVYKIVSTKKNETPNNLSKKRLLSDSVDSPGKKTKPTESLSTVKKSQIKKQKKSDETETDDNETPSKNKLKEKQTLIKEETFKSPTTKRLLFDDFDEPQSHKKQKKHSRQSSESQKEESMSEVEIDKKKVKSDSNSKTKKLQVQRKADLTEEYLLIAKQKPPSTVQEYYTKFIYEGPENRALKKYKSLEQSEKDSISKKYQKAHKKYNKKFEAFAQKISREEFEEIAAKCRTNSKQKIENIDE